MAFLAKPFLKPFLALCGLGVLLGLASPSQAQQPGLGLTLAQGRDICERLGIPLLVDRHNTGGELTWAGRIGPGYAQAEGSEQDLTSLQLMLALTQPQNDNQVELTQMVSFVYQLAPSVTQEELKSFLDDVATMGEASLILDGRIIQAKTPEDQPFLLVRALPYKSPRSGQ